MAPGIIDKSREMLLASKCQFCRLLGSIIDPSLIRGPLEAREFSANAIYAHLNSEVASSSGLLNTTVIGVTSDRNPIPVDFIGCRSSVSPNAIVKPREINKAAINYDLIKTWISSCEKSHGSLCWPRTENLVALGLRVIDCVKRRIIEMPRESSYVALSYVWGAAEPTEVLVSDSSILPTNLPRVIEDSLLLVRNLGYRYLWVDRYCIDQGNEEEKHSLISAMHVIYGNAKLTIIAAAGNGPTHGLPGVGSRHREQQQCLTVGNNRFIRTFPHVSHVLGASTWSKRGWTFQEGILSNRRLIFTDQQVAFQCNSMHCCESLDWPYDLMQEGPDKAFSDLVPEPPLQLSIPRAYSSGWGEDYYPLLRYIEQFTKKTLSYPDDRMKAFLGVLSTFANRRNPIYHIWGAPVLMNVDRPEISLNWLHATPCRRVSHFPSWSWAGWDGPIEESVHSRLLGRNEFTVTLSSKDSDNISLETFYKNHSAFEEYALGSRYLHLGVQLTAIPSFRYISNAEFSRVEAQMPWREPKTSMIRNASDTRGSLYARFPQTCGYSVLVPLYEDDATTSLSDSSSIMMFPTEKYGTGPYVYIFMVVKQTVSHYERVGLLVYGTALPTLLHELHNGKITPNMDAPDWGVGDVKFQSIILG
ncbi:HET-domain-containing protein [Apiospora rasikravindrae]|uniref:HET-domain-containing protein n=1 Tax=Apiospora rasikravindrae TaxID=990691 RepID=A0ABR1RXF7_9PEZI